MSGIFNPAATAKAVHATLNAAFAAIPEGHTKAVIIEGTHTETDGPDIEGAFVLRGDDGNWGFVVGGGYNRTEGAHGGFKVAWSGK